MNGSDWQSIFFSLSAGGCAAGVGYALVTVFQSGREEARRFRAMGKLATSPWFKLLRPLARVTAFFIGAIFARIELALGRRAQDSYLATPRLWAERKLRAAAYPEGVTADEFLGLALLGGVFATFLGLLLNMRLNFAPVRISICRRCSWLRNQRTGR